MEESMRIKLEMGDYQYVTTISPLGEHRFLIIHVNGKPFGVHRTIDQFSSQSTREFTDRWLVEQMEKMLRKVFVDACAAIEPGTEILP
jgi:hypothetical protein